MGNPQRAHDCCVPSHAAHTSTCCCSFSRRYPTKAERREALESYRTQLHNELTGVEERLESLED